MEENVRVLFLSNRSAKMSKGADAYNTRMEGLRHGLEALGMQTDTVSLRALRFSRPHLAFTLNAPAIARLAQGYNVIHAGGAGAAVAAAVARLRHPHRVIFDVHGDEVLETRLEWQVSPTPRKAYLVLQAMLLSALACRMADLLLVVSEPFRQHYLKKGVPSERIILTRNGVDASIFSRMPPRNDGRIHISYAGGFQAWQAIDTLIEAFAQIDDERLQLHLIGFSPQEQSLKTVISARLGEHVTLEDWLPIANLVERLGHADLLIIPRTQHPAMQGGLPSKFAEYLAVGRPVIVTNVDETATFVRQYQCGLVCGPTAESLAQGIRRAVAWSEDERQILGCNARRLAETVFDWRVIAQDYATALHSIILAKETSYGGYCAGTH